MKKSGDSSGFPGIFTLCGVGMRGIRRIDERIDKPYNEDKSREQMKVSFGYGAETTQRRLHKRI